MNVSLLDAKGAAEVLNVPKSWVLAQARDDLIPHIRLGRYVRFDRDELLDWCRSRQRGRIHDDKEGASAPRHRPEAWPTEA